MTGAVLRYVRTLVTPDAPPAATDLTDENFDASSDAEQLDETNTTATTHTGSGSFFGSDEWALTGGFSGKVVGTAQDYLVFTLDQEGATIADHSTHYVSLYLWYTQQPGSDCPLYELRNGGNLAAAAQFGITDDGKLFIRNGNSATSGANYDETAVQTLDSKYIVEITYGASVQTAVISSLDGTVVDTLTCALTDTSFSYERAGLLSTISGGSVTTGNLEVDNFDSATTGAVSSSNKSGADSHYGSGSLTISTAQFITGTKSLRVNGTAFHQLHYDHASHTQHYVKFYIRRAASPASDMYIWQAQDGAGTTVAAQLGVNSSGQLFVRDSNTGVKQTAAAALTVNTWFKVLVRLDGSGGITAAYYSSGGGYTTLVQTFAAATTLTATNFSDDKLGLNAATTGTPDIYIDSFESDDTQYPGTAGASPVTVYLERIKSDSAAMPDRLDIAAAPDWDENLMPAPGKCAIGATTPITGGNGSSVAGLNEYYAFAGADLAGVHFYKTNAWSGVPTSNELAQAQPSGRQRAIILYNWKPSTTHSNRQVADGAVDDRIDAVAVGLRSYPHKVMLAISHERDNDNAPSHLTTQEKADYVDMWQHVVDRMGLTWGSDKTRFPVMVWNQTGFATWVVDYTDMYPGDDYVDVIAFDHYGHTGDADFSDIVEPSGGGLQWARTNHPSKPIMLAEIGVDFTDFTDSQAAAIYATFAGQAENDYPDIRWIWLWNANATSGDYQIQDGSHPLTKAAWAAVVADDYFTVDTSTAP